MPRVWTEAPRAPASRGRRSRNKVSVGEPAEGSLFIRGRTVPPSCTTSVVALSLLLWRGQKLSFSVCHTLTLECTSCAGEGTRSLLSGGEACLCYSYPRVEREVFNLSQQCREVLSLSPLFLCHEREREGHPASHSEDIAVEDASAQASMKSAANCETSCDTRDPVNHRTLERLTPGAGGRGGGVRPDSPVSGLGHR